MGDIDRLGHIIMLSFKLEQLLNKKSGIDVMLVVAIYTDFSGCVTHDSHKDLLFEFKDINDLIFKLEGLIRVVTIEENEQ